MSHWLIILFVTTSGSVLAQSLEFWTETFAKLPWVEQAAKRNEQRRPVCSARLPQALKALEQNPRDETSLEALGRCKLKAGQPDEALAAFRRIVRMKPERGEAYSLIGFALLAQDRTEDAREMFEAALRFDPTEDQAHRGLGQYHAAGGRLDKAIQHYEEALRLANPKGPNLFNPDEDYRTVAFLQMKVGQGPSTLKAFEQARVFLLDKDVLYGYGLALGSAGRLDDARIQVRLLQDLGQTKLAAELETKLQ